MGVLAEYLRTEAEHLRAERQQRKDVIVSWEHALGRLFQRLDRWIRDADAGLGLLAARQDEHAVEEPKLGKYWSRKLTILFGDVQSGTARTVAEVVPRARFVVSTVQPLGHPPRAADGMVIIREGRLATHYLFLLTSPGAEDWFICTDAEWDEVRASEEGRVKPLTSDLFETAVLGAVR
jgi:hypothetical protein